MGFAEQLRLVTQTTTLQAQQAILPASWMLCLQFLPS